MEDKKVELNLGLVCNNYCKFCMNDEHPRERRFVPFRELEKELNDFYKRGYRAVGFLGGEPTIYPKLTELITLASRLGYRGIHLVSNGRQYRHKEFLHELIAAGVSRFYISIHSHKPGVEDFLTSVKGCFREKIKGIANLVFYRNQGIIKDNILLNTVINKYNYRDLAGFLVFYKKNFGLRDFRFNFIRPAGRAFKNFDFLVPRYSQIREYLLETINTARRLKLNLTLGGIPFCFLSQIDNFQEFVGEFKDGSRQAIFGSNNREEFSIEQRRRGDLKAKHKSCQKCIFNSTCEGPWANYVKVNKFCEFKPVLDI